MPCGDLLVLVAGAGQYLYKGSSVYRTYFHLSFKQRMHDVADVQACKSQNARKRYVCKGSHKESASNALVSRRNTDRDMESAENNLQYHVIAEASSTDPTK